MYITYDQYREIYDDNIDQKIFDRLAFSAFRVMDIHTTGIDNDKKLRLYFPEDEFAVEVIKNCAADLIHALYEIHQSENAHGYEVSEHGVHGKIITSISAGNESISYAAGNAASTAIDAAVTDRKSRDKLMADIVWEYLRGIDDANGVNLLYLGKYHGRFRC